MVVRIRLARGGRRHLPYYRIVASDARAKRDGRFLETLGGYAPLAHGVRTTSEMSTPPVKRVYVNVARIRYWISTGAQPTRTGSFLFSVVSI